MNNIIKFKLGLTNYSQEALHGFQSRLVDIFLFILILLNVTAVCLESVKSNKR